MKRVLAIFAALGLLAFLCGCLPRQSAVDMIGDALSLDCSGGELIDEYDSHDGFLGDGVTFCAVRFDAQPRLPEECWRPLPLPDELSELVYGTVDEDGCVAAAPMIIKDNDWEHPLFPEVSNGAYMFIDRHSQSTDSSDYSAVLTRSSFNFTVAVYDFDTDILYFGKADT